MLAIIGGRGRTEVIQRQEKPRRRTVEEIRAHEVQMVGLRERNRPTRPRIDRRRWVVENTGSEEELVVKATEEDKDFGE